MNTQVICDLHLHSKYSRAVSSRMVLSEMARWAKLKGIDILGTGDFTHPLWFREIKASLEEMEEGLFGLKGGQTSKSATTKFLLTAEISSIYTQGGKTRRIHNLVLAPSLETVEKINSTLVKRGCNLASDGRPIIGISSRDLVEIIMNINPTCMVIPCHAWTPWFSLYGSASGFDSIEECFGEMSKYIYGIETGLSSDPAMNWRIPELDNLSILSFSDAHSGAKLGREATIFSAKCNPSASLRTSVQSARPPCFARRSGQAKPRKINYMDIIKAIKKEPESDWEIGYTIEFYPEEGKYHFSGHRNCKVRQSPEETKKEGMLCPVCHRGLTIGVMHRVEQLAKREVQKKKIIFKIEGSEVEMVGDEGGRRKPYKMLVPLEEIIMESFNLSGISKRVSEVYLRLINNFGSEFNVLMATSPGEIKMIAGEKIAEGIEKVRKGNIMVDPGYDGVFGKVSIWPSSGKKALGERALLVSKGKVEDQKSQLSLGL